jgi:hypothetical protein
MVLPSFVTVIMLMVGAVTAIGAMATVGTAKAGAAPVKEVLASHIGWDVNKTKVETPGTSQEERNICTVASKDECQAGEESSEAGGFRYPEGVAAAPNGNIYVADSGTNRVQEFSANGEFVLMFGWDVNKTKVDEGTSASQQEKNICTSASKDICQAGVEGSAPGQFGEPQSIAVDPVSGDVYVQDFANWRVDEYTAEGQFVLMIGKEVNETRKGNLCSVGVCAVFVDRSSIPGCPPGPGMGCQAHRNGRCAGVIKDGPGCHTA